MTLATWTDDRIEQLKKLWEAGLSASQIAAELGHVSRNAVIGKVHRLGLSGRVKGQQPPKTRKIREVKERTRRPRSSFGSISPFAGNTALAQEIDAEEPLTYYDNVIPVFQKCTLQELTEEKCHWPLSDPQKPDFAFCGGKALADYPYCAHHCRIAYQSPSTYRLRKRK